jgi:hypothetical protein
VWRCFDFMVVIKGRRIGVFLVVVPLLGSVLEIHTDITPDHCTTSPPEPQADHWTTPGQSVGTT